MAFKIKYSDVDGSEHRTFSSGGLSFREAWTNAPNTHREDISGMLWKKLPLADQPDYQVPTPIEVQDPPEGVIQKRQLLTAEFYAVIHSPQAHKLMERLSKNSKPGSIIFVSPSELEILQTQMVRFPCIRLRDEISGSTREEALASLGSEYSESSKEPALEDPPDNTQTC